MARHADEPHRIETAHRPFPAFRGVEVQPQRRCSDTSSDTEPRAATLTRRRERGRSGKRPSPRRTSSAKPRRDRSQTIAQRAGLPNSSSTPVRSSSSRVCPVTPQIRSGVPCLNARARSSKRMARPVESVKVRPLRSSISGWSSSSCSRARRGAAVAKSSSPSRRRISHFVPSEAMGTICSPPSCWGRHTGLRSSRTLNRQLADWRDDSHGCSTTDDHHHHRIRRRHSRRLRRARASLETVATRWLRPHTPVRSLGPRARGAAPVRAWIGRASRVRPRGSRRLDSGVAGGCPGL